MPPDAPRNPHYDKVVLIEEQSLVMEDSAPPPHLYMIRFILETKVSTVWHYQVKEQSLVRGIQIPPNTPPPN